MAELEQSRENNLHRQAAWAGKSDPLQNEKGVIQGLGEARFGESELKQGNSNIYHTG